MLLYFKKIKFQVKRKSFASICGMKPFQFREPFDTRPLFHHLNLSLTHKAPPADNQRLSECKPLWKENLAFRQKLHVIIKLHLQNKIAHITAACDTPITLRCSSHDEPLTLDQLQPVGTVWLALMFPLI